MQFQKISIPPPWKGFFLAPLHPTGNSSKASYISLYFLLLQNTPSPRKFQSLLLGEYGYFLELHIWKFATPIPASVQPFASQNCAVPENIHTSPMEGVFSSTSPPLWKFQLSFIHFFIFFALPEPPIPQEILVPSVGGVWIFSGTCHLEICDANP